jgi:hypothetical protein
MRTQIGKRMKWTLGVAIFAGFLYSAMALHIQPAYAATCDCTEERQDASDFCANNHLGLLDTFQCPYGTGSDHYLFTCSADGKPRYTLCD